MKQIPENVSNARILKNWMSVGNVPQATRLILLLEIAYSANSSAKSAYRTNQVNVFLAQTDTLWFWTVSKKKQEFVQLALKTARPVNMKAPVA